MIGKENGGKAAAMRERIADALRTVCERDGAGAATVTAVMAEAGMTRELFYHYFADIGDATEFMLDRFIEECVDSVRLWDENLGRNPGDFAFFAPLFRRVFYDNAGGRRPMHQVLVDLGRFGEVKVRTIERVADYLSETDFARNLECPAGVSHRALVSFALYGCFGVLQSNPRVSDAELAGICQRVFGMTDPGGKGPGA